MAKLPSGINGRTEHDGSVWGDTRIVWEVTASFNLPEMQSVYGTGEVERTGKYVCTERTYHFIAPADDTIIKAFFTERFRYMSVVGEPVYRPLYAIDGEISFTNK